MNPQMIHRATPRTSYLSNPSRVPKAARPPWWSSGCWLQPWRGREATGERREGETLTPPPNLGLPRRRYRRISAKRAERKRKLGEMEELGKKSRSHRLLSLLTRDGRRCPWIHALRLLLPPHARSRRRRRSPAVRNDGARRGGDERRDGAGDRAGAARRRRRTRREGSRKAAG
jgi:hypothetical protein